MVWILYKGGRGKLAPYYARQNELTINQGCVMWGLRVIIPVKPRQQVINQIHEVYLSVVKMKVIAQSFVWWPGIDRENLAKSCRGCQQNQNVPPTAPLNALEWPTKP